MTNLSDLIGLVIAFVVIVGIASALFSPLGSVPKLRAKVFLTDAETAFYRRLRVAAAPLNVAPQVAMAAIVTTAGGSNGRRRGSRNTFDRKIIDFVLFDDDGNVKLLVELDDRTHRSDKDAARDKLTASAGHLTLRMRGSDARDVEKIRNCIDDALEPSAPPTTRWQRRK